MNLQSFPLWKELPELELYLDQVLFYVNQVNQKAFESKEKVLTAAMVNNYVKHHYIPKPNKKKYSRSQLARLIALTTLKPVFPISDIIQTIQRLSDQQHSQQLYDDFVLYMRGKKTDEIEKVIQSACQTLILFHQTTSIATSLKGGNDDESDT